MRIGVIGSGISGLVARRLLLEASHQVTLFERQPVIGIDAGSIDVRPDRSETGIRWRADVPSRMFNQQQWPALYQLYQTLGVEHVDVNMSQSFGYTTGKTYLKLKRADRTGVDPDMLLRAGNRKILRDAERLRVCGMEDLDRGLDPSTTFAAYLREKGLSREFVFEFLYPTLSSTVCTCSYNSLDHYPAVAVLEILRNLVGESSLHRTKPGTREVARRLLGDSKDVHLNCPVSSALVSGDRVLVTDYSGQQYSFDHLVVSTQANHVSAILPKLSGSERKTLEAFEYESIPIYVHTDEGLMPRKRRDWATFNMLTPKNHNAAMCTVWLNSFHSDWQLDVPVFQTINALTVPDPDCTFSHTVMQRPVVHQRTVDALNQLRALHAETDRRIWFCGAYASPGTPLLESGVLSAQSVVRAIGKLDMASLDKSLADASG